MISWVLVALALVWPCMALVGAVSGAADGVGFSFRRGGSALSMVNTFGPVSVHRRGIIAQYVQIALRPEAVVQSFKKRGCVD